VVGQAVLTVGMWKGTVSGGVFTPSGPALLPPTDDPGAHDLRALTLQTTTATYALPAFTLAANETLFVELWRHQLDGTLDGNAQNRELDLHVNDGTSFITHPPADDTGPTHAFSINPLSGTTYFNSGASTLYYNGNADGSFTVNDALTDSGSGPKDVTYPLVSTAGWTHSAETISTAPSFTSSTYSWTAGSTTSPGAQTIVGENNALETSNATLTLTNDTTPPSGQTVALSGGPNYTSLSVPLTLTNGTDTGAGIDAASGLVERASATMTGGTCGTFGAWAPVTLVSGADTSVTSGNCYHYRYTISDLLGNQSAPSTQTADATVDSTGPTVTIDPPTETSGGGDQYYAANVLWFRPAGAGSFTLNATATDPVSGITQVSFPSVATTSGWAGSTGGVDTVSPYSSPVAYTWTAGAAAPGALTVTATNGTGATSTATVTISADTTAPAAGTIALGGSGPWFKTTSIPLTITRGTDTGGSGVDATRDVVERASAPLTNGNCGTYGTYAAVSLTGGADTTVATDNCYRYQAKTTDNVGNVSVASTATSDAKVDTTPPTTPTLTFSGLNNTAADGSVVYFRPNGSGSFTVTASSTDPESGVTLYTFPTIPGFTMLGSGSSRTYTYTTAPSAPLAAQNVTATNGAGVVSSPGSFTLVPDPTAPTVTVRCNNAPCKTTVYPNAVSVTISADDGDGSGIDTVRYSTDGTNPTADGGNEYVNPLSVRSLTRLKVRAYDKAGNVSALVTVTIRSGAQRIVFTAPVRVNVRASARYLQARVSTSRKTTVAAVLTGPGMRTAQRWRFILASGASIVQLRLPASFKRTGRYTLVWHLTAGSQKATKTSHIYRLAAVRKATKK